MSDIEGLVTGLSQGMSNYLGYQMEGNLWQKRIEMTQRLMGQRQQANEAQREGDREQLQGIKDQSTGNDNSDPVVTRDMAVKMAGDSGGAAWDSYTKGNPNKPLTLSNAQKYIKDNMQGDKQQDSLEKSYEQQLISVRGDQSLMRTESQRDAAGLAYDTIQKAQSEHRDLSEVEYSDVLGQLWKVRTGASPTEQVLNDLRQRTAKEGINRVITYATGNPNLIGATTQDTLNNIKQFVQTSGSKADQQWDSYMAPRMNPPSGLNPDRAAHIQSQHRGIRFADQMAVSNKTYPISDTNPSGPKVGDVMDGYTYKGGDPSKPESWSK